MKRLLYYLACFFTFVAHADCVSDAASQLQTIENVTFGSKADPFVRSAHARPANQIKNFPGSMEPIRLTKPSSIKGVLLEEGHSARLPNPTGMGWRHIFDRHFHGSSWPAEAMGNRFPEQTTFGEILLGMRELAQKLPKDAIGRREKAGSVTLGRKKVECKLVVNNNRVITFYPLLSW